MQEWSVSFFAWLLAALDQVTSCKLPDGSSTYRGWNTCGLSCSSSLVSVVFAGGPAHQSGLCQGDSVLQLNGLPVETWKCADLAHAIRWTPHSDSSPPHNVCLCFKHFNIVSSSFGQTVPKLLSIWIFFTEVKRIWFHDVQTLHVYI